MNDVTEINQSLLEYGVNTAILFAVVFLLRMALVRGVLKIKKLDTEDRRRWIVNLRNTLVAVFIIGVIMIWAPQLSTFAVSLMAIALALVLATKEILACVSGALLRIATNAYGVGDRIEIAGVRGNVMDLNLLTTTLLEIGPGQTSHQYTGRATVIPNSLLLNHTVTNESYTKKFIVHVITVRLTQDDDWQLAEEILLNAAREECAPYIEAARRYLKKIEGKNWLDAPSVEPRVTIQIPEANRITLLLRVPSPTHRPSRAEQAILRRFLSEYHARHTQAIPENLATMA